jgi:hypothetical protein
MRIISSVFIAIREAPAPLRRFARTLGGGLLKPARRTSHARHLRVSEINIPMLLINRNHMRPPVSIGAHRTVDETASVNARGSIRRRK